MEKNLKNIVKKTKIAITYLSTITIIIILLIALNIKKAHPIF